MASLNRVFLIGNLTRDPEVRYTPSGMAVSDLRLAVNTKGKDRDETLFINVTVWDKQAENCQKYLSKGAPIFVEGRLKMDEWEKDGQKNTRINVVASRVQFLSAPRNVEFGDGAAPAGTPAARPAAARPATPASEGGEDEENLPF